MLNTDLLISSPSHTTLENKLNNLISEQSQVSSDANTYLMYINKTGKLVAQAQAYFEICTIEVGIGVKNNLSVDMRFLFFYIP